jgi:hypothetical protein
MFISAGGGDINSIIAITGCKERVFVKTRGIAALQGITTRVAGVFWRFV